MITSVVYRTLVLSFFAFNVVMACDEIPAGQTFWIRLLEPVSSFQSETGSRVRAILAESPMCDGVPMFPRGTEVDGTVRSARSVGLGFGHETARLELQFSRLVLDYERPVDFNARVIEVANARESVKGGVVHGIQSVNTPQGRITSRLKHLPTWNPYTDWGLIVYRLAFPISPEPEIYFPAGTDLQLQFSTPLPVTGLPVAEPSNRDFTISDIFALDEIVHLWPVRTSTPTKEDADVVNLALIGSREQVEAAFQAAGWLSSDSPSKRSVMRQFYAFITLSSYSRAPVSKQLFEGRYSEFTWEKSLNSYGKRDHLRIWSGPETLQEQPIWAVAASRETGAVLSVSHRRFVHRVDSNLDAERDKVVRDLTLSGCVDAAHTFNRPSAPRSAVNATGDPLRTDGSVAAVRLKDCSEPIFEPPSPIASMRPRPGNKFTRYVRMQVLGVRNDVWRGNIVYGGFDLGRMTITALRKKHSNTYTASGAPTSARSDGKEEADSSAGNL
jgi:LssY C-terminus